MPQMYMFYLKLKIGILIGTPFINYIICNKVISCFYSVKIKKYTKIILLTLQDSSVARPGIFWTQSAKHRSCNINYPDNFNKNKLHK